MLGTPTALLSCPTGTYLVSNFEMLITWTAEKARGTSVYALEAFVGPWGIAMVLPLPHRKVRARINHGP